VWYQKVDNEFYIILPKNVLPHPWAVTDFPVEKFNSVYGSDYRSENDPERFFPFPSSDALNRKI